MGHKNLLLVAIIILLVAVATMAHPVQKRVQPRGIWGMETDYSEGLGIKRPRAKMVSSANQRQSQAKGQVRPKSIGGGAGALVGGAVASPRF